MDLFYIHVVYLYTCVSNVKNIANLRAHKCHIVMCCELDRSAIVTIFLDFLKILANADMPKKYGSQAESGQQILHLA